MMPHYHYWLFEVLGDGRFSYVKEPTVYDDRAVCWRNGRRATSGDFMVLQCYGAHEKRRLNQSQGGMCISLDRTVGRH